MEDIIAMTNKDLYTKKLIKKGEEGQGWKLSDLEKEIAEVKKELDRKVTGDDQILTSGEILELSQKLDKLIVKYMGRL